MNSLQVLTKAETLQRCRQRPPASSHRPEEEGALGGGGGVADSVFTHNELCSA